MRSRLATIRRKTARVVLGVVLTSLALGVAAAGCAYYNTLYNAKARFKEAENQPRDREGNLSRTAEFMYDEVIEKCRKMIATWPDSRHVDDARLLIAQSFYGSQRFGAAVSAVDTLIMLHPDTNLMPRALSLKGAALTKANRYEEAIQVLEDRLARFGSTAQVLFNLSSSAMSIDRSDEAVRYLNALEKDYPDEAETFDARVAIAEILAEKEQYEESRAVYQRLGERRIPDDFRYRVWMGSARVDLKLQRYADALATLDLVDARVLTPEDEAPMLLVRAKAQAGTDSVDAAIATYTEVTDRFSRGEFAAEAHYRLGQIYEDMDSLQTARQQYESVAQAYANSEYARDAIRRGNNLSQLMKLQAAADDDSPEAMALREFSIAELQLFQFNDTQKALASYQRILTEFPDTEFAPKAAYAVGYIYGVVMVDSVRAWESYRYLLDRYPGTQQAAYADQIVAALGGGSGAPRAWSPPAATTAPADTSRPAAGGTTVPGDTTGTQMITPADTVRTTPTPADTAGAATAPGDSTTSEGEE